MTHQIFWRRREPAPSSIEDKVVIREGDALTVGRAHDCDIVLADSSVSRRHAKIILTAGQLNLTDNESRNGIFVDGRRVTSAIWHPGQALDIGPYRLETYAVRTSSGPDRVEAHQPDVFPPDFFDRPQISVKQLRASGLIEAEADYLALGGGLGSFAWVDHLRIFGVKTEQIRILGIDAQPYAKYKRLCRASQIPDHERLRSNSISTPDNIWGFPGYASRETMHGLARARLGALKYILQVFGEPAFNASYTPRAGDVYRSIDQEAARIGWPRMWLPGRILKIRQTDDGRHVVAYRVPSGFSGSQSRNRYVIARYIHLAMGYPASRFLNDLQDFKRRHPQTRRLMNAYEDHDEIYRVLAANGGTVVVRGRGIVASRILQKLSEVRAHNKHVQILHLMRSHISKGKRYDLARRPVSHSLELQPFNWPKACWGGTLRRRLERTPPDNRFALLNNWGGTTTADRPDWERIIDLGKKEGWYRAYFGEAVQVELAGEKLVTRLRSSGPINERSRIEADFIIDCTGLIADLKSNPVLADVIDTYGLRRNVAGHKNGTAFHSGLHVSDSFEIEGMRTASSRAFAAGVLTANGPYAAVDSFLGLQYAALRSVDALHRIQAPGISGFGALKSLSQWLKWCSGRPP